MDIESLLSLIDEETDKRHTIYNMTSMKWQIEDEIQNSTDRNVCYSLMETKNSMRNSIQAAIEDYDKIYNEIQMIIQEITGGTK